jgi:thiol-disulfide isomerase/thioredoxin
MHEVGFGQKRRQIMKNLATPALCAVLTGALAAMAAEKSQTELSVGDPAPKLQVGKWVQGDPVKAFDSNHVYVVEFWAVWCAPCRTSIPHLNDLHEKFKDKGLVVIGQNVWEGDESNVAPFIQQMGRKMTYRVALDKKAKDGKGVMSETWMTAAGQNGIPAAFVVDRKGRIAWLGHPMELDDKIIEDVLADRFDVAGFRVTFEQQQQLAKQRDLAGKELRDAMRKKDWDTADRALAQLEKATPESMRSRYGLTRLQILLGKKDYDAAYKLAESLNDAHKDESGFGNDVAWTLALHEGLDQRGLNLAEKIASQANSSSQGKSSAVLDTLARIQFLLGKKDEAIATQQKALDAAADEREKPYLKKVLDDYKQGKLPSVTE